MIINKEYEVVGLLWQRKTDGIMFSAYKVGESRARVVYLEIPNLEAALKQKAVEYGMSVGDLCDFVNLELNQIEDAERRAAGIPVFKVEFKLTEAQARNFRHLFEEDADRDGKAADAPPPSPDNEGQDGVT